MEVTMINKKFPAWLSIEKKGKTLFLALTIMYSVYVLPIILANRFFQNDLSHSLYGITGWNNDARPLIERLIIWLCGGFPLTLVLGVLLLAYTVTMYTKRYLPYVMPERKALWKIFVFSFFMLFSTSIDIPRLFVRAVSYGFGVIVYKYVILNRYIRPTNGGWQSDAYRFAWKSGDGLFFGISQNFQGLHSPLTV